MLIKRRMIQMHFWTIIVFLGFLNHLWLTTHDCHALQRFDPGGQLRASRQCDSAPAWYTFFPHWPSPDPALSLSLWFSRRKRTVRRTTESLSLSSPSRCGPTSACWASWTSWTRRQTGSSRLWTNCRPPRTPPTWGCPTCTLPPRKEHPWEPTMISKKRVDNIDLSPHPDLQTYWQSGCFQRQYCTMNILEHCAIPSLKNVLSNSSVNVEGIPWHFEGKVFLQSF